MKSRWKISIGIAAVGAICGFLLLRSDDSPAKAVEDTRRALRQQGFKTELSEFNFFASPEQRVREAALTNAHFNRMDMRREDFARQQFLREDFLSQMQMTAVDSGAVIVAWKFEPPPDFRSSVTWTGSYWGALGDALGEHEPELEAACAAVLSGPIRFDFNASHGSSMLMPQLAVIKSIAQTLGQRTMLELHDNHHLAAWTNLLAATRLVTAWDTQPIEIVQLLRSACVQIVFNTTWQALQSGDWSDRELAELQREWAATDFFKNLPETVASTRACAADLCQQVRDEPLSGPGLTLMQALRSPREAWYAYRSHWQQLSYRRRGSFEDEKALLLHYADREKELRRAVQCSMWSEMRSLPGVTNQVPFQSRQYSRVGSMLNMRQLTTAMLHQRKGLLGQAAEAEARRRILLTALALERHRLRHGVYPKTLAELSAELLPQAPVDFMDGKPLRYRPTDDGHFVLYSVGLDCSDEGGLLPPGPAREGPYETDLGGRVLRKRMATDIVWPQPASTAEMARYQEQQVDAIKNRTEKQEEEQAQFQWEHAARRQAKVEKILAEKREPPPREPTHDGGPLGELLANSVTVGTNRFSLDELLTPRQIVTGEEPEIVTFDVPIAYDVLTNVGELELFVDPVADPDSDAGSQAEWCELRRATNGNCRLVWNTIFESPGEHALIIGLTEMEGAKFARRFGRDSQKLGVDGLDPESGGIFGPAAKFVVSNICQFSVSSAFFNPAFGGTMRAKLPESNASYSIEFTLPAGDHVRTITGNTSNGIITVFWDLTDDRGVRVTNVHEFKTIFDVTLTDSGRQQRQKGP